MARVEASDGDAWPGDGSPRFMMPAGRLPGGITALTLGGLMLVAAGGAWLQMRLLRLLAPRPGDCWDRAWRN